MTELASMSGDLNSDSIRTVLQSVNVVVTVLLGLGLYSLNTRARRLETMEQKVADTSTKLIEERIRAVTHNLANHVQGVVVALDDLKRRLNESEDDLGKYGDVSHQQELRLVNRVEQVKDYIRDHTASKGEVRVVDQKVDVLNTKVEKVAHEVAGIARRPVVTRGRE